MRRKEKPAQERCLGFIGQIDNRGAGPDPLNAYREEHVFHREGQKKKTGREAPGQQGKRERWDREKLDFLRI